jgi:lactose/L-arabinose transport system ATP-binding protein
MSELKLREIKKSYSAVDVIHGVDLDIADGEFVVFVGPSGCGKSTLLRVIAGLESATSGRLEIDGEDVTKVAPADRGVAMVFQSYALYPHMNVEQNMSFGLKINGFPKAEIQERVLKAARILHLEPLLHRKPKQLSGGQRQRVAIGRAIVREPKVFLFDEPLSNLDAELRVQMRLEIAKLHSDLGATMIYVTHDQVEAMTLADKIVVLRSGRIEQIGAPMTLYNQPANMFVAGFIGSPKMNFFKASVAGASSQELTVRLPDFNYAPVTFLAPKSKPAPGTELRLGVRPEHFSAKGQIRLDFEVDVVENLGSASYAYARSASNNPLTVEIRDDPALKPRTALSVGFDVQRAFLFDPTTGLRVS